MQTSNVKSAAQDANVGGWVLPEWRDKLDPPSPLSITLPQGRLESLPHPETQIHKPGIAVLADVANLDMVCRDQYGFTARLHYGQLLHSVQARGNVQINLAFVPDIPQTLATRHHLRQCGFTLDLLRPKYSHGRLRANADTAMAAFAVRWASDPTIQQVELWTGDGDFLRVYDAIRQAWPEVSVVFRSFEAGTAVDIQALEEEWIPIDVRYVEQMVNGERRMVWPSSDRVRIHELRIADCFRY
ncbi:MAG: NYN domain-containing protein [Anaerolineae bacterium]|nr:NYN domain-containing protein [Anaerolineae bacterium]